MSAERILAEQLMKAAEVVEQQIDDELSNLEKLSTDDLDKIREQRMNAMKAKAKQRQEWEQLDHGQYTEIPEEKQFFEVCKKSQRVACHFYRNSTMRCNIVDKHMKLLAPKHMETKFCKINAEKCPFLVDRLKVTVMPTILLLKDSQVVDRIMGFGDLGNTDEFTTETLEKRLSLREVIDYEGDRELPAAARKVPKIIRGKGA